MYFYHIFIFTPVSTRKISMLTQACLLKKFGLGRKKSFIFNILNLA